MDDSNGRSGGGGNGGNGENAQQRQQQQQPMKPPPPPPAAAASAAASVVVAAAETTTSATAADSASLPSSSSYAFAAAAAAAKGGDSEDADDDAWFARRLQAVERLVQVYGFDVLAARNAVEAVDDGSSSDDVITKAYIFLLDQGYEDKGGPVVPIDNCPHVLEHVKLAADDPRLPPQPASTVCTHHPSAASGDGRTKKGVGRLKCDDDFVGDDGTSSCPSTVENWLCLECGAIRCSRYVNGHGIAHWKETQQQRQRQRQSEKAEGDKGGDDNDAGEDGHCVHVSLADLSAWCHRCNAYVKDPIYVDPVLNRLQELKFGTAATTTAATTTEMEVATATAPAGTTTMTVGELYATTDGLSVQRVDDAANTGNDKSSDNSSDDRAADEPERKKARATPASTSSSSNNDDDDNNDDAVESKDDDKDDDDDDKNDDDDDDLDEDADRIELNLADIEGNEELMTALHAAAIARGIPLQYILQGSTLRESIYDDDNEDVEYSFGEEMPRSLEEIASFIQSDKCKSILILAGAGMSVARCVGPNCTGWDGRGCVARNVVRTEIDAFFS